MNGSLVTWTERIVRVRVEFRAAAIVVALLCSVVADRATGPDVTVDFLYALGAVAAAWFISLRWGMIAAGAAATLALLVDISERDERWLVLLFNNALRGASFAVLAWLASALRSSVVVLVDTTRLDEMTGILSRRGFLDELATARRRAIQRQAPFGVVYLDLDGLKTVNDTEGHAAGDALLRRFVRGVSGHLRATDAFGRLGGDEFAIVLERADPLVIDGVVGRIVNDPEVPHVSCGVRVFDGHYPSPNEMLAGADRRMYEDKQRRRDALITSSHVATGAGDVSPRRHSPERASR
jgi:diguanylate cyclase (GGDEF)-like protein